MKINKKKFLYLISPNKIYKSFYGDLIEVLRSNKIGFFQLRLKKTSFNNKLKIAKEIKKICQKFKVKLLINDDPLLAKKLEDNGASAIMPLASPIGSGLGILNKVNISLIIKKSKVPIIIDAGIGTASEASIAMEMGCDGVLVNSAIANSKHPILMAKAFKDAVISGRNSYLAGRMKKNYLAIPSSPSKGVI